MTTNVDTRCPHCGRKGLTRATHLGGACPHQDCKRFHFWFIREADAVPPSVDGYAPGDRFQVQGASGDWHECVLAMLDDASVTLIRLDNQAGWQWEGRTEPYAVATGELVPVHIIDRITGNVRWKLVPAKGKVEVEHDTC